MKQFINAKENMVTEAIDGAIASSGGALTRLDGYPHLRVVVRADWDKTKVALVSGGGSGHEPAHAGFVGAGMLTAAVCGDVFASPSVAAVLAGILAVTGPAGCLLIVKNYTGDRLNFGLAAERARAFGYKVSMVIVDDDVALPDLPQARGLAGTLFVHKIVGAMAENGATLAACTSAAQRVVNGCRSIGMSLDTCTVPGSVKEDRIPEDMAELGLRKVVQFQDVEYGTEYLGYLEPLVALDHGDAGYSLSIEAAKYIANAMAYDDIIRVADLKTRRARFERITAEMGAENSPVELTEFFHPRAEEITGMLPARLGAKFETRPHWMARLDRLFGGSRRIRTHRLGSFLMLYFLGGLRGYRRRTLRHKHEQEHLQHWLAVCHEAAVDDYAVAVELLRSHRLVKGYSDTHARSLSKFDKVLLGARLVQGRQDAAKWVARLREAALQDEQGEALDGAIQTLKSFTDVPVDVASGA